MKTYYLEPIYNNQKSFYKKAKVNELDNGTKELISYKTKVCLITKGGKFIRVWDGYSMTTKVHINEFRQQNGMKPINKAEWDKLEIKNKDTKLKFIIRIYDNETGDFKTEKVFERGQEGQIISIILDDFRKRSKGFYYDWMDIQETLKKAKKETMWKFGNVEVFLERREK